jgi:MoxR-like ATPase
VPHMLETLAVAVQTPWKRGLGIPVLYTGHPGIGKTSMLEAAFASLGLECETIIASLREPSDFAGIPFPQDGVTKMLAPWWAYRLSQKRGALLLDEINTAAPSVQAALLRVCLDKIVGDTALHPDTAIVAAMNPADTAAGGWDLAPPLANRFMHIAADTFAA